LVGTLATLAALPVYPLAVRLWGALGVALLTTVCLFVYTLALSLVWRRKHGGGAFAGLTKLIGKTLLLALPGTALALLTVRELPLVLPTLFPALCALLHPALLHAVTLGVGAVAFALPYVGLARVFLPEALALRRKKRT
ncbi:MAG: murein biosynthesis integral membrane protein MurJ, partial [Bilophila sp.]